MQTKISLRAKALIIALILKNLLSQKAKLKNSPEHIPAFDCGFNGLKINYFIFWLANRDKIKGN